MNKMNKREKDLLTYLVNSSKKEKFQYALNETTAKLEKLEELLTDFDGDWEALTKEAHNLRLQKLLILEKINRIDQELIRFELSVELAD